MSYLILMKKGLAWLLEKALEFLRVCLTYWWVCLIVYLLGYSIGVADGVSAQQTISKRDIANIQAVQANKDRLAADARALSERKAKERYQQENQRANQLAGDVLVKQQQIDELASAAKRRVNHVTTVYKTSLLAEPAPIPHCVFTRGWLREYVASLGYGLPQTESPADSSQPETQASPASAPDTELLESGVTPADILTHAADYGAYCQKIERQVDGLVKVLEPGDD